jgi:hypothetical protein
MYTSFVILSFFSPAHNYDCYLTPILRMRAYPVFLFIDLFFYFFFAAASAATGLFISLYSEVASFKQLQPEGLENRQRRERSCMAQIMHGKQSSPRIIRDSRFIIPNSTAHTSGLLLYTNLTSAISTESQRGNSSMRYVLVKQILSLKQ